MRVASCHGQHFYCAVLVLSPLVRKDLGPSGVSKLWLNGEGCEKRRLKLIPGQPSKETNPSLSWLC